MEPVIGKHSMLILDGSKHHRHRALISPYFSRAQFTKFGDDLIRLIFTIARCLKWHARSPGPAGRDRGSSG
jgi:cytochrome P450